ncbi:MAG TPA: NTP transferase domain-containing protein [Bacillota bacterium]|nr:NTP transferase domain-containing protein [Bacillota bacterium]
MKQRAQVIIMAAGEGTRMKSSLPKVMHRVSGNSILDYVLDAAFYVSDKDPILVIGKSSNMVKTHIGDKCSFAYQRERLGTGHAVMMAVPMLEEEAEYLVVLAGDTPLIRGETILKMLEYTLDKDYDTVAISAIVPDPTGYGRMLREPDGNFKAIVEHKDASEQERSVSEVNASMFCFKKAPFLHALGKLKNDNAQNEYYLTDVLTILKEEGKKVGIYAMDDYSEMLGVNNRTQLAEAESIMRRRINKEHMLKGVTMIDPLNTYIEPKVELGKDTIIYPDNVLEGKTIVGEACTLYPGNRLKDTHIGNNVTIESSVIIGGNIEDKEKIGPYTYIDPGDEP